MAGAIVAVGLFVYAPPLKKLRNNNGWRRFSLALSLAGLVLGAVSLGLNWVSVSGTVTTLNASYDVDILLYPFSSGSVSINNGLQYKGADISSLVHPNMQSVRGSPGPVLTMYLIPIGCALALTGLYKPKNARKRNLKAAILVLSGLLIVTAAVHTFIFVQGQAGTINGASICYGAGIYIAVISGALTMLSGLFTTRENHNKSHNAKVH